MESPRYLIGQVAAEHGISPTLAKRALYLQGLASQGRSVDYACRAMRLKARTVKAVARRFLIDLADYRPYWRLEKKGEPRPEPEIRDLAKMAEGIFAA